MSISLLPESAVIIQQAYRRHYFLKNLKKDQELDIASEFFKNRERWDTQILRFPPIPLKEYAVRKLKVAEVLKHVPEAHQVLMRKFVTEHTFQHLSFPKFRHALSESVCDFFAYLHSLPHSERDYVIVVDEEEKSTNWCVSLMLPEIQGFPPVDIVVPNMLENVLRKQKNVKHVLLIDDACYSGSALYRRIYEDVEPIIGLLNLPIELHVVVPFMTKNAKQKIVSAGKFILKNTIRFAKHSFACTVSQLSLKLDLKMEEREIKQLENYYLNDSILSNDRKHEFQKLTLLFFDHKIADELSTFTAFLHHLVGNIPVPYKKTFREEVKLRKSESPSAIEEFAYMVRPEFGGTYLFVHKKATHILFERNGHSFIPKKGEMIPLKKNDAVFAGNGRYLFNGMGFVPSIKTL
jgi:hypothetical protein